MLLDANTVTKAAAHPTQGAQLAAAQERIRSLEELVDVHETAQRQAADREAQLFEAMPQLPQTARAYERIRALETVIEGLRSLRRETAEREERLFATLANGTGTLQPSARSRPWWKVWNRPT